MKLIDADALIEWLGDCTEGDDETVKEWFASFTRVLWKYPEHPDAAIVTKCKNCAYYGVECVGFGADGFCSEAKRRA